MKLALFGIITIVTAVIAGVVAINNPHISVAILAVATDLIILEILAFFYWGPNDTD